MYFHDSKVGIYTRGSKIMNEYSVLMSVYYKESAHNFDNAIKSMLNQTVPPNEFVIVCDGTLTDELERVIDKYTSKKENIFNILRLEENKGLGNALHIGIEACKNELIVRMDSDDISVKNRVELQLKAVEKYPDASVIGGQIVEFRDDNETVTGKRKVPLDSEEIRKRVSYRNPVNHVTVLLKKSDIIKVGNYQDMPGFEDYYLWIRLIKEGYKIVNIEETCCYVRVSPNMYARRGGMQYFKNTQRFEQVMLKLGVQNHFQYVCNLIIRFLSSVVVPNKMRHILFNIFLRKK